jgi:glucose-6-phosphate 1-dehydrogenase
MPGLSMKTVQADLDLSYGDRFRLAEALPDAYTRLIFDVLRGDHNMFVRDDELVEAWKIFTPILHKLEQEKKPIATYPFGVRLPENALKLLEKYGIEHNVEYAWCPKKKSSKM